MKRRPHPFATEADLCAAFIAWAQPQGWTAYPETAGWDVLLVGTDGTQIGVQAKLLMNISVLKQATPSAWQAWADTGPDFIAVLVPDAAGSAELCSALGVTVIHFSGGHTYRPQDRFYPELPNARGSYPTPWHYRNPGSRHRLPAYVPDVPAGASGPVQLTQWKVGALRICATLEVRGHVTRADFKRHGIDPRRWTESNWLRASVIPGQFTRGPALNFADQHPGVYPQVLADIREALTTAGEPALTADEVAR